MLDESNKLGFVVSNFEELESRLIECLSYIPYIENNKQVISPKFIPIILEACSLIDSVFKNSKGEKGKRYDLMSYTKLVEHDLYLEEAISIFLNPPLPFLTPFENWTKAIPTWWVAYNKLKHDRLDNYDVATYENAILAMTGLHQVISRSVEFAPVLLSAGWLTSDSRDVGELLAGRFSSTNPIPVASKLFVSPVHSNFISYYKGHPAIEPFCDFTGRVKDILAAHEWL